ncbi:hypothetical protein LguiA_030196 [Lonicera macranthoides]
MGDTEPEHSRFNEEATQGETRGYDEQEARTFLDIVPGEDQVWVPPTRRGPSLSTMGVGTQFIHNEVIELSHSHSSFKTAARLLVRDHAGHLVDSFAFIAFILKKEIAEKRKQQDSSKVPDRFGWPSGFGTCGTTEVGDFPSAILWSQPSLVENEQTFDTNALVIRFNHVVQQ